MVTKLVLANDRETKNYQRLATQDDPRETKGCWIAQVHVPKQFVPKGGMPEKLELEIDLEAGTAKLKSVA